MATFYLINTILVGTTKLFPGTKFDDASTDTAAIEAAGGLLWPTGEAKVDDAATMAQNARLRGANEATLEPIMQTAVQDVQKADDAATGGVRQARGVCFANMSLTAFVGVTGGTPQDGVTYVKADRVLLANQTTAAQNGLYDVGTVSAGTAPLTRSKDMPALAAIRNGMIVEISEGTIFAGSTWKSMATGAKVVGTDDPLFYPRVCKGRLTLAAGTKTLGAAEGLFLFSTTTSQIQISRVTPNTSTSTTGGYQAQSADRTAGKSGTAAAIVMAAVAAGTINVADLSTLDWLVANW